MKNTPIVKDKVGEWGIGFKDVHGNDIAPGAKVMFTGQGKCRGRLMEGEVVAFYQKTLSVECDGEYYVKIKPRSVLVLG